MVPGSRLFSLQISASSTRFLSWVMNPAQWIRHLGNYSSSLVLSGWDIWLWLHTCLLSGYACIFIQNLHPISEMNHLTCSSSFTRFYLLSCLATTVFVLFLNFLFHPAFFIILNLFYLRTFRPILYIHPLTFAFAIISTSRLTHCLVFRVWLFNFSSRFSRFDQYSIHFHELITFLQL